MTDDCAVAKTWVMILSSRKSFPKWRNENRITNCTNPTNSEKKDFSGLLSPSTRGARLLERETWFEEKTGVLIEHVDQKLHCTFGLWR
jgi:hypothetical protein